jgi:hypothetical protein
LKYQASKNLALTTPPSDHKIIPPADIEERHPPLTTKTMMAVITTGKTNLALPSMRVSEPCVEVFPPDIQCVDDDVVCLLHIFAKKSVDERARIRLILPRRGHYVQEMHAIALPRYCGPS